MDATALIRDLVAAAHSGPAVAAAAEIIPTLLMLDGRFAGRKFRYDGGYAIQRAGGKTIDFYDEQGKLLKTAAVDDDRGAAA
jgi:hypothetical protein